jgi:tetratricopeptide (TPR) repeat protein
LNKSLSSIVLCSSLLINSAPAAWATPMDDAKVQMKSQNKSLAAAEELESAVKNAEATGDFTKLITVISPRSFGLEKSLSTDDRNRIASLIDRALLKLKTVKQTDDTRDCQAMIARYFNTINLKDRAIEHYKDAISSSEAQWKQPKAKVSMQPPGAAGFERSCKTALALLYLDKGNLSAAERLNREVNWPWADMPGEEKEKMFRDGMSPAASRSGPALLASRLAVAYDAAGNKKMAARSYANMLAHETFSLDPVLKTTPASIYPTIITTVTTSSETPYNFNSIDFDQLVGVFPSTETIVRPFIGFAERNPALVPKEKLRQVKGQLQTMAAIKLAKSRAKLYFDWEAREGSAIDGLVSNPKKSLAQFKTTVAERKKLDTTDPTLPQALTKIAYHLILAGRFSEARNYISEAIALQERHVAAGRFGLGQSTCYLAVINLEEGKLAEAKPLFEKALKLRDGDQDDIFAVAKTRVPYGKLLALSGKNDEGKLQLDLATKAFNAKRSPFAGLAGLDAMLSPEVFTEKFARHHFEDQTRGWFVTLAAIELSQIYVAENQLDSAKRLLLQTLSTMPDSNEFSLPARVHEKLARVEMTLGNLESADKYLTQAELACKEGRARGLAVVDILSSLGDLRVKQERKTEARAYYRDAADKLAKTLGPQNKRVLELRRLSTSI